MRYIHKFNESTKFDKEIVKRWNTDSSPDFRKWVKSLPDDKLKIVVDRLHINPSRFIENYPDISPLKIWDEETVNAAKLFNLVKYSDEYEAINLIKSQFIIKSK